MLKVNMFFGLLVACLCLSNGSFAQLPGGMYDPQTVETVYGKVDKVEQISHERMGGFGVHLILKTDEGKISVHLGPGEYLSHAGLMIAPEDELKVTGSKVTLNNETFMIASEIEKEGKLFILRDKNGVPMWSGRVW